MDSVRYVRSIQNDFTIILGHYPPVLKVPNVKGSDEVPFLVAILLNGTNPRFCLNVNGFLRSCRPCHINTSNLEVLLFCTRGREGIQCRGKHKLQILKKEMVVREKGPKGRSKLKLNTSRPDLIYNKKYYRTIPYFASEHTCEHPIAFRVWEKSRRNTLIYFRAWKQSKTEK